jgi:glycosyltransferase involved in cell wall biosynthesis
VYPHGESIACPDAIGRHLAENLGARWPVVLHDWDETKAIVPEPGDVLLGHAHPAAWTVFRRSARRSGWARVIAMSPYNHGDLRQIAYMDRVIAKCDHYLAITGDFWFTTIANAPTSHWLPKMVQLDLAVDRAEFPVVKEGFADPGKRRFIFIGRSHFDKNVSFLSRLATSLPDISFAWIGDGRTVPGLEHLGPHDFRSPDSLSLVSEFDFLITVGLADSNPASILEAIAWGLIPVCTPESGYTNVDGIVNVSGRNLVEARRTVLDLQHASEEQLNAMRASNWAELDSRFTWQRFAATVERVIEAAHSPSLGRPSLRTRITLRQRERQSHKWGFRRDGLALLKRDIQGSRRVPNVRDWQ